MSSMILFSLALIPLDMMSKRILESVRIWTGTGRFKMNSNCFRFASASSVRSASAMTSADNTERATRRDLYELYETGIALLDTSVRSTIDPSCKDKPMLLANAASLYATTQSVSRSSFGIHMDALLSWAYLMALFRRLQCLDGSCSDMVRVTCAIREISKVKFGLVFANHANFILMEANLPNSASLGICSILFK